MYANRRNFRVLKEIGVEEHDSDVRFQTGSGTTAIMHPAIIIGIVRSLWTWLWGRYHVPQNAFLVINTFIGNNVQRTKKEKKEEKIPC